MSGAAPLDLARVVVIGTSCSGKTTVARRLASDLGCPHVELDALYWTSRWMRRPPVEFRDRVREAIAGERWVVDGNYGKVRDLVWGRATAVVWLNLPFRTLFARAVARGVRRSLSREELFSGNRESLGRTFFSRHSILWWILGTYRRRSHEYRRLRTRSEWSDRTWIELRSPHEIERWLGWTLGRG